MYVNNVYKLKYGSIDLENVEDWSSLKLDKNKIDYYKVAFE